MGTTTSEMIPDYIGKYKIVSLLAKGGMGAVYKALHPDLKRTVIIKKLAIKRNAMVLERFKREAKILLDLNNTHIVHLFDYFKEGNSHYLVIEFVDGMSLDKLLVRKEFCSEQMAMTILLDVCIALKYAHDHGIIHRDVKPGNILLSKRGEIKLADFGIAASEVDELVEETEDDKTVQSSSADLTIAGSSLGTPSYMSPEQFTDSSRVDKRTDIYSLGVMLYEMVTGEKPFKTQGKSLIQLSQDRLKKLPNPRKIKPKLSLIVVYLIRKMTKVKQSKRFQDLAPVIKIIRHYLKAYDQHEIRVTMVKNMLTRQQEEPVFKPRRNPLVAVLAIILAVIALGLGGTYAWKEGWIHGTILRLWYSPVTIEMKLPKAVIESQDLDYSVFFFEDDNDKLPEVTRARTVMISNETENNEVIEKTKTTWLKQGKYRAKIVAGPRIWWKSFTLAGDKLSLEQDFGNIRKRTLQVYGLAKDIETGKDITKKASFSVLKNKTWTMVSEKAMDNVTAGNIWQFRVQAPGYKTATYSLKVDWFQDELILEALLEPDKE